MPEGRWTSEDIADLPSTPVVVVLDDGHRRADLDALIDACLTHNSKARLLISCRPSLVDSVKYHLSPPPKPRMQRHYSTVGCAHIPRCAARPQRTILDGSSGTSSRRRKACATGLGRFFNLIIPTRVFLFSEGGPLRQPGKRH